ncbi:MAG: hypothetical protein K2J28_04115 [Duncaniella sp.]|nr:hypothetical protein [Duncaniella sp.]
MILEAVGLAHIGSVIISTAALPPYFNTPHHNLHTFNYRSHHAAPPISPDERGMT